MSARFWTLEDIPASVTARIPSGIAEMDKIYGCSRIDGEDVYGFPLGKISYWAGERGAGKTRLATHISKLMNGMGARILVFQGEVMPHEFRQQIGIVKDPKKYFISDGRKTGDITPLIDKLCPHLIIIDSVNMVEGFESRKDIHGIFDRMRQSIVKVGSHLILIGQLNQDGTAKGGTKAPHLCDVEVRIMIYRPRKARKRLADGSILDLSKGNPWPGGFVFEMMKIRGAPRGSWLFFIHKDKYIELNNTSERDELLGVKNV